MAAYSDSNRLLKLTTPLGPDKLLVLGFSGQEGICELFEFTLELLAPRADYPDPGKLVGKGATLAINAPRKSAYEAQGKRVIHGIVRELIEIGEVRSQGAGEGFEYVRFRAVLVPWLWNLTRAADCRIFQGKTAPEIIEQVFKDRGFSKDYRSALSGSYQARDYCVQYRETDFAFVTRLMEEEGIYYFFEHREGQHQLVIADAKSAHQSCGPGTGARYRSGQRGGEGAIRGWSERRALTTAKYAVQSFNFETPSTNLLASVDTVVQVGKNASLEIYDYPQGYTTKSAGDQTAKLRMEAIEARHQTSEGTSDCAWLMPGCHFKLVEHYRSSQNGDYLVVRLAHEARNDGYEPLLADWVGRYENSFTCIPKNVQYRCQVATPRPRVRGVQTAIVVGPNGEEIYTDKYGRIKVQFHWDRLGKNDENSSCWIRVAQGMAANSWGTQFIPRIGSEVLVDFIEGDPDRPLVIGSLYNAQKMPPYALPANMTQSGIKTRSSKQGGADNFNELRFEDKKGSEDIYFHAEKDFHRVVENNDDLVVGSNKSDDGSQTIVVWKNRTETVKEGDEKVTVEKGNREVKIASGNETLEVSKGNRTVSVDTGNDTQTVKKGNRVVDVQTGNDTHKVQKGNRDVEIAMGNDTLTIKMGNQTTKLNLGKSETQAMQSITLKVGQSSVVIDQKGVTIKGLMVTVEGQVQTTVKGVITQVNASALLDLKGTLTKVG